MCIDPLLYVITGGPVIEGSNRIFVDRHYLFRINHLHYWMCKRGNNLIIYETVSFLLIVFYFDYALLMYKK